MGYNIMKLMDLQRSVIAGILMKVVQEKSGSDMTGCRSLVKDIGKVIQRDAGDVRSDELAMEMRKVADFIISGWEGFMEASVASDSQIRRAFKGIRKDRKREPMAGIWVNLMQHIISYMETHDLLQALEAGDGPQEENQIQNDIQRYIG